jgi:hypothetical protein
MKQTGKQNFALDILFLSRQANRGTDLLRKKYNTNKSRIVAAMPCMSFPAENRKKKSFLAVDRVFRRAPTTLVFFTLNTKTLSRKMLAYFLLAACVLVRAHKSSSSSSSDLNLDGAIAEADRLIGLARRLQTTQNLQAEVFEGKHGVLIQGSSVSVDFVSKRRTMCVRVCFHRFAAASRALLRPSCLLVQRAKIERRKNRTAQHSANGAASNKRVRLSPIASRTKRSLRRVRDSRVRRAEISTTNVPACQRNRTKKRSFDFRRVVRRRSHDDGPAPSFVRLLLLIS